MKELFDQYNIRARIFPALFSISPLVLIVYLMVPAIRGIPSTLITLLGCLGLLELFCMISRINGNKVQQKMGVSVEEKAKELLSWKDKRIDPVTKARYHIFLAENVPGYNRLSREEEEVSPEIANKNYRSAINWLKVQTRDSEQFKLILEENINYGFCRNLYGLKKINVIILTLVNIVMIAYNRLIYQWIIRDMPIELIISHIIAFSYLNIWVFIIKPQMIMVISEKYAYQLLAACDKL